MKKLTLILGFLLTISPSAKAGFQEDCLNKYKNSLSFDPYTYCSLEEAKLILKEIQDYYLKLSQTKILEKWNNGNGMQSGNFKEMYDNWNTYKNKMCSLVGTFWGYIEPDDGSIEKQQAQCLLNEVKTHRAYLRNIYNNKDNKPLPDIEGIAGKG